LKHKEVKDRYEISMRKNQELKEDIKNIKEDKKNIVEQY
jgi:hypothetical protein